MPQALPNGSLSHQLKRPMVSGRAPLQEGAGGGDPCPSAWWGPAQCRGSGSKANERTRPSDHECEAFLAKEVGEARRAPHKYLEPACRMGVGFRQGRGQPVRGGRIDPYWFHGMSPSFFREVVSSCSAVLGWRRCWDPKGTLDEICSGEHPQINQPKATNQHQPNAAKPTNQPTNHNSALCVPGTPLGPCVQPPTHPPTPLRNPPQKRPRPPWSLSRQRPLSAAGGKTLLRRHK